eukprot:scaffold701278_cov51-Attheya_sp.AAC.2
MRKAFLEKRSIAMAKTTKNKNAEHTGSLPIRGVGEAMGRFGVTVIVDTGMLDAHRVQQRFATTLSTISTTISTKICAIDPRSPRISR